MKNKRGISLISLGIMVSLILILAVLIIMLFITALEKNINNLEYTSPIIDEVLGDRM